MKTLSNNSPKLVPLSLLVLLWIGLGPSPFLATAGAQTSAQGQTTAQALFQIKLPASQAPSPFDGRLFLMLSTNNEDEPRFQISDDFQTQQIFGMEASFD